MTQQQNKNKDKKELPLSFCSPRGPYGIFSNSARKEFKLDNTVWKTVTHYYYSQAFKGTPMYDVIRTQETASGVKKEVNRKCNIKKIRKDWDEIKYGVMYKAIETKFTQLPEAKKRLLDTGDRKLIYHTEHNSYWGDGYSKFGQNTLGKIMMIIRKIIKNHDVTVLKETNVLNLKRKRQYKSPNVLNQREKKRRKTLMFKHLILAPDENSSMFFSYLIDTDESKYGDLIISRLEQLLDKDLNEHTIFLNSLLDVILNNNITWEPNEWTTIEDIEKHKKEDIIEKKEAMIRIKKHLNIDEKEDILIKDFGKWEELCNPYNEKKNTVHFDTLGPIITHVFCCFG